MKPRPFQVTFYAQDPPALARFWAGVLGYVEEPPPPGFASWEDFAEKNGIPREDWDAIRSLVHPDGKGPRVFFHRIRKPKSSKNHLHLDVTVTPHPWPPIEERRRLLRAEAERLRREGASVRREVEKGDEFWIAMADPDGNEFCLQ